MKRQTHPLQKTLVAAALVAAAMGSLASDPSEKETYCMNVDLGPFHMVPGFMTPEGACAVRDYWDGRLQRQFYPFTIEDHQFNCEVFGDLTPLPTGDLVPSSVVSEGDITGTIGGLPFTGKLLCASLTNWYADYCPDPPNAPCFQLAQPFFNLIDRDPYPRVTEVSVFDGVITVARGKGKTLEVPVVIATRAAGITHLESLDPPQVGASVTHNLLGMVTYEDEDAMEARELKGSLDVLLQGHIFFPDTVANDPGAARVRGAICSKDLAKLLNQQGKKHKGRD
jgi:hypothetical protein